MIGPNLAYKKQKYPLSTSFLRKTSGIVVHCNLKHTHTSNKQSTR